MTIIRNICGELISSSLYPAFKVIDIIARRDVVLMYHSVSKRIFSEAHIEITYKTFSYQLSMLRELNYNIIKYSDMLKRTKDYQNEKAAVLTFDDGFSDNYEFVCPLLMESGFGAIFFIIPGAINGAKCRFKRGGYMKSEEFMNWSQIRDISDEGFEIGSHSMTHPDFRELSAGEAYEEMISSKKEIEDRIGIEVRHFCFPYGKFRSDQVRLLIRAGYESFATTRPGMGFESMEIDGKNIYLVKRIEVTDKDKGFKFKKKLSGSYIPQHIMLQNLDVAG
jgi:peptidoglycan/xylan/chitin deacetylase (PgdA/CDA1 family)